jgi:rRNA biogenesis protein RRP5
MIVYYLRGFEGVVNIHHLPLKHPLSLEKFTKKKIQGRVLWVDMLNKRSGLTLHTELVQNVGHQFTGMKIGTIFHDAEIILVEPHKGVVLSLPGGGRGFSPLRLMYDTKTDKVTKIHSLGSHHSCRVVQFNYIDGAAIVSLQDSILEESLMTVDDVVTGSLVEGVVSKMIAKGANIRLGKHVFGFCPLDESHSKVTRRKFVEGQTVKCRVMFVDVPNQFVMLSCRRGLISSQLPPLLDIASAVVGQYYDGQIISVADGGIVVQFYNKITGFIPPMELCSSSAQVVLDPKSAFKFGQVITCRVVQIGERRLKLSLRAVGEATPTDTPKVSPGEILDLEVTGIMSGGLSLVYPTTKELIYLPTDALSDYPHHCHELLSFHSSQLSEATSRGSPYMLHGVLMLTRGSSLSPAVGTLKKLLIQAATDGSYPKSFVEEKVGMILPGVVKRIYSYGCFIEFPNGLIGLAPIRLLSDDFISDAAGIYKPMQTVIAKVHDQDEEKEEEKSYSPGDILKAKVIGFINAKAAQARIKSSGPTYLELTTRESLLTDDSLINDKSIQDAIHKDYVVGELVMGVIKKIFKKTMIVSLTPHLLMCVSNSLIPRHSKTKKHFRVGQVVKCAIIKCTNHGAKEVQYHGSMLLKSSLVGHIVEGVVSKILPYERLEVNLGDNVRGFVDVTDISDHFIGNPLSYFNVGDKYNFYCLQKCSNGKYYLSLRQCHCGETPSCFPASSDGVEPDREISTINDIEEGLVLRGYLKAIDHNGAFVKLGRIVTGRVMICNLSDRYIRNYQSCYSQGELVRVKVIRYVILVMVGMMFWVMLELMILRNKLNCQ